MGADTDFEFLTSSFQQECRPQFKRGKQQHVILSDEDEEAIVRTVDVNCCQIREIPKIFNIFILISECVQVNLCSCNLYKISTGT